MQVYSIEKFSHIMQANRKCSNAELYVSESEAHEKKLISEWHTSAVHYMKVYQPHRQWEHCIGCKGSKLATSALLHTQLNMLLLCSIVLWYPQIMIFIYFAQCFKKWYEKGTTKILQKCLSLLIAKTTGLTAHYIFEMYSLWRIAESVISRSL